MWEFYEQLNASKHALRRPIQHEPECQSSLPGAYRAHAALHWPRPRLFGISVSNLFGIRARCLLSVIIDLMSYCVSGAVRLRIARACLCHSEIFLQRRER